VKLITQFPGLSFSLSLFTLVFLHFPNILHATSFSNVPNAQFFLVFPPFQNCVSFKIDTLLVSAVVTVVPV
jgi:hypothetical protein